MSSIQNGAIISSKVIQKIFPGLHRGNMESINAIVVHQTDSDSAQQTFNKYAVGHPTGAHFLIDKHGVIYQTALLTKQCMHVGRIKSRCYEEKSCTKIEFNTAHRIYHEAGIKFSVRAKNLHLHEKNKTYPDRYPLNEDSIGIEVVGRAKKSATSAREVYESVNAVQNSSLKWLINELYILLNLRDDDVYRHPDISRKNLSEASTANW